MAHKKERICDRCSSLLAANEDGYLVWSEAGRLTEPDTEMGVMVICEECANKLFTDKLWRAAKDTAFVIEIPTDMTQFVKFQRTYKKAIDFSIAMRAKRRGLGPAEARQEARDLAQLLWKDESTALRQLRAQRR